MCIQAGMPWVSDYYFIDLFPSIKINQLGVSNMDTIVNHGYLIYEMQRFYSRELYEADGAPL